jgi:ADP-ribose pyrophosphatase YjhB (NUDIX family)
LASFREARHCPQCGGGLTPAAAEGRERLRCAGCGFVLFLNPACAAAGVVFNGAGEVLLVRRAIEPWRGFWALPAGYQEIDEGPEHALAREVREETGLEVEVLGLLDLIYVDTDPRKPANVAVYLCRARPRGAGGGDGGALRPDMADVDAVAWFALDALPERIGFDNHERILSRLGDPGRYPPWAWNHIKDLLGGDA